MAATLSLRPLSAQRFGYAEARHLLLRAGFGGTPRQIAELQQKGLDAAVDQLVDYDRIDDDLPAPSYDPYVQRPYTEEERRTLQQARRDENEEVLRQFRQRRLDMEMADRRQMQDLRRWWLDRMIRTQRPLEEKLTLFWHGHFASNHRTVRSSVMMLQQNKLLRLHARDDFARLAVGIVRDPAMLKFLNNDSNRRGSPNENLARELMELFTLGEGNYTEMDIREGARALTGYGIEHNDFQFFAQRHDNRPKQIFGRRGDFDGDDLVLLCLQQPSCPLFISLKLYRYFVSDLPHDESVAYPVVRQMARQLIAAEYRLGPVLKTLFKSEHFYDRAIMGQMIKTPAQLLVGVIRTLDLPRRDNDYLVAAMNRMGQHLFDPPSVKGWDGGRAWINTSTLFTRQNLTAYLITGETPRPRRRNQNQTDRRGAAYNPMFMLEGLRNPSAAAVVDHLAATLLANDLHGQRREQLVSFLEGRGNRVTRDDVIALLLLMTALPEFQLC